MHLSFGTEPIPFTRGHRVIHVKPQTFFLNDFFSWNLIFWYFKVHHEFIIIFRNYFSIKWNFRKIYPARSNSEQLPEIEFLKIANE